MHVVILKQRVTQDGTFALRLNCYSHLHLMHVLTLNLLYYKTQEPMVLTFIMFCVWNINIITHSLIRFSKLSDTKNIFCTVLYSHKENRTCRRDRERNRGMMRLPVSITVCCFTAYEHTVMSLFLHNTVETWRRPSAVKLCI